MSLLRRLSRILSPSGTRRLDVVVVELHRRRFGAACIPIEHEPQYEIDAEMIGIERPRTGLSTSRSPSGGDPLSRGRPASRYSDFAVRLPNLQMPQGQIT